MGIVDPLQMLKEKSTKKISMCGGVGVSNLPSHFHISFCHQFVQYTRNWLIACIKSDFIGVFCTWNTSIENVDLSRMKISWNFAFLRYFNLIYKPNSISHNTRTHTFLLYLSINPLVKLHAFLHQGNIERKPPSLQPNYDILPDRHIKSIATTIK